MKIPNLKIKIRKFGKTGLLQALVIVCPSARPASWESFSGPVWPSGTTCPRSRSSRTSSPRSSPRSIPTRAKSSRNSPKNGGSRSRPPRIPEVLKNAIIATEDPRFYTHKGVDYMGILRAVKEDVIKIGRGSAAPREGARSPSSSPAPSSSIPSRPSGASSRRCSSPARSKSSTPRIRSWSSTATSSTSGTASTGSRPLRTCFSERAFRI